jgi:hypothetical protein
LDPLCYAQGIRGTCELLQQYGELVAAHSRQDVVRFLFILRPGHDIGGAEASLEPVPHLLEQRIADIVTETVIHYLEVIEVDEEHCCR